MRKPDALEQYDTDTDLLEDTQSAGLRLLTPFAKM